MLATSYFGYLETIRKMGVDVYTTRDLNQSIWWMIGMHGYLGKHHYPRHKKYFTDAERAVGVLMIVPGVGEARARKALEKNSITDMIRMKQIDGLTITMTEKLKKIMRIKL